MLEGQWLADMWGRPSSLGACKTAARRMPDLICFKIQGCIFGRKSVSSANFHYQLRSRQNSRLIKANPVSDGLWKKGLGEGA
ncbi:hypothetical protein Q3G72_029988 [Acer saccharum]|nr:hypothetical protein Q3G72_029988 [Acer saccharum]